MLKNPFLFNLFSKKELYMACANSSENNNVEVITRPSSLENPEIHVLAVDDSFVDRKVIEQLLKISSCKVTVVESGKKALQLLGLDEEHDNSIGCTSTTATTTGLNVHLIITDYSMPEMTGYDLLRKIKESSTFREVPVVIMSSENILTRIDRCLEEGAKEYIIKPVKLSDVKRIKEFIMRSDGLNEAKGGGCYHPRNVQEKYLSSSKSFTFSTSSPSVINPVLIGFPCPSSKCNCRSRHLRFRKKSLKYPSRLSLQ